MEWISHPVPAAIVLLGILVVVHELGHFLVGRWCGIGVEVFSVGFGPTIVSFKRRGTDYRLSLIPLGGYVKFLGSTPTDEIPDAFRRNHKLGKEFYKATVGQRSAVAFAGPAANFALAILAYAILGYAGIPHPPAKVGTIMPSSAAEKSGLLEGDLVKSINGENVASWEDLQRMKPQMIQIIPKSRDEKRHRPAIRWIGYLL